MLARRHRLRLLRRPTEMVFAPMLSFTSNFEPSFHVPVSGFEKGSVPEARSARLTDRRVTVLPYALAR